MSLVTGSKYTKPLGIAASAAWLNRIASAVDIRPNQSDFMQA
jgi:hypothetical protein